MADPIADLIGDISSDESGSGIDLSDSDYNTSPEPAAEAKVSGGTSLSAVPNYACP